MIEANTCDDTSCADLVGQSILNWVRSHEQSGTAPVHLIAGLSAACIYTLKRYGAVGQLATLLRMEADRLDHMDRLDRRAAGVAR